MSKQYSPFAALSSREQQERWLEFQNTKLPYVQGDVESGPTEPFDTLLRTDTLDVKKQIDPPAKPTYAAQTFQQIHHKQYDAVIKRMQDAAKQTKSYQPFVENK